VSERTVKKRLSVFERYLSVWVALCMVAGVALGKLLPGFTDAVRRLDPVTFDPAQLRANAARFGVERFKTEMRRHVDALLAGPRVRA